MVQCDASQDKMESVDLVQMIPKKTWFLKSDQENIQYKQKIRYAERSVVLLFRVNVHIEPLAMADTKKPAEYRGLY